MVVLTERGSRSPNKTMMFDDEMNNTGDDMATPTDGDTTEEEVATDTEGEMETGEEAA